jgi:hypothetical protein
MSRDSQVWLYEVIRLEVGKALPKVLESGFAPKSEATRENARKILKARFEDNDWPRTNGGLKPEAVRFLNDNDEEVVRYTVVELLSGEGIKMPKRAKGGKTRAEAMSGPGP